MKIGLVGESPNDTACIEVMLSKLFPEFEFVTLIKNINGCQLDQLQPTKQRLRLEYEINKPDIVVFIRDLDGFPHDQDQLKKRKDYFTEFKTVVDKKAIFCLIVFELEAYILSDVATFNEYYSCNVPIHANPDTIKEPKELLKFYSSRYTEGQNLKIFSLLNVEKVLDKCQSFQNLVHGLQQLSA